MKWAETTLEIASQLSEFQALKDLSVGDGDVSALATNEILDAILDDVVALREAQAQHDEQQNQSGAGEGEGDEAGDQGAGDGDGDGAGAGEGQDPNGEIDGDDPNDSNEWEPSEELIDNLRSSMRSASEKALEQAQELSEALSGAGSKRDQTLETRSIALSLRKL